MQRDLAVRARAQPVPGLLELALDRLEIVELAVDDDPRALVFAGDRLIAGRQVDDAQPRMAEGDAPIGGDPVALAVGPAMVEAPGGAFDRGRRDGRLTGKDGCNAAHGRKLQTCRSSGGTERRPRDADDRDDATRRISGRTSRCSIVNALNVALPRAHVPGR